MTKTAYKVMIIQMELGIFLPYPTEKAMPFFQMMSAGESAGSQPFSNLNSLITRLKTIPLAIIWDFEQ